MLRIPKLWSDKNLDSLAQCDEELVANDGIIPYDWVFLGVFFTLRYSWVSSDIFGYMWFHLFCGGREPNI